MKILVVDDEKVLVKGIKFNLENEGYQVTAAYDGASAVDLARRERFDLIILDLMMPVLSGSDACMKIREFSDVPIIMLTARSEDADKLMGFARGADDYVTKPFNILELKARIRALLRRAGGEMRVDDTLRFEDLALEPGTFQLSCGERTVRLSRREYDLMESLMRSGRQILTKEQLLVKVWGYDSDAEDNNVEVYISFLRRKLTHLHSRVKIRTQRMVGYCLEVEG